MCTRYTWKLVGKIFTASFDTPNIPDKIIKSCALSGTCANVQHPQTIIPCSKRFLSRSFLFRYISVDRLLAVPTYGMIRRSYCLSSQIASIRGPTEDVLSSRASKPSHSTFNHFPSTSLLLSLVQQNKFFH